MLRRRLSLTTVLLVALLAAARAGAQQGDTSIAVGTVAGTVHGVETGPDRFAEVLVPQWGASALADSAGHFRIAGLPPGRWLLIARQYPLGVARRAVDVRAGGATDVDLSLAAPRAAATASVCAPRVRRAPPPEHYRVRIHPVLAQGSLVTLELEPTDTEREIARDEAALAVGELAGEPVYFTRHTDGRLTALAALPAADTARLELELALESGLLRGLTTRIAVPRRDTAAAPADPLPALPADRRRIAEAQLRQLVRQQGGSTARLWSGRFVSPRPGPTVAGTDSAGDRWLELRGRDPVVRAAGRGVVALVADFAGEGRVVMINHGDGLTTEYRRLDESVVEIGDTVSAGQPIGRGSAARWLAAFGEIGLDPQEVLALPPAPPAAHVTDRGWWLPRCR